MGEGSNEREPRERKNWVRAERIADLFNVSVEAVYERGVGLDHIRFAYLTPGDLGRHAARRYWWADALVARSANRAQVLSDSKEMKGRIVSLGREWVRAATIAEIFDVSVGAVHSGFAGMDQIRSARLSKDPETRARRWYLPDATALSSRMLARATAFQQEMNAPLRFGLKLGRTLRW